MPTIEVQPRDTPGERADTPVEIAVDDAIAVHATTIEDWTTPRQNWDFVLREGHDFGRTNNVEGLVLYVSGEHTSSLTFRFDQVDAVEDTGEELVIRFEENDGIAKIARLTSVGLDVRLFHILTFT
jgi:uncharacterized protein YheU (UPF0270 family)